MTEQTFQRVWVMFEEAYRPKGFSAQTRRLYWHYLHDMPDQEFEARAADWLARNEFMPRPMQLRPEPTPESGTTLIEGLEWLDRAMKGDPWRNAPDRVVRILRLMGGDGLRMTKLTDVPFRQKDFERHWEHAADAEPHQEKLPEWTPEGRRLLTRALSGNLEPGVEETG